MPIAPTGSDPIAAQNYQNAMNTYGNEIDTWLQVNEKMLRYRADRFEVGFATAETRQLISNLALPLALHQQARYLPAPVNSDMSERMWNAASSIVVTRSDAGLLVPNYSKLGGTVAAAFLGKALFAKEFNAPELDSNHFVARYIGYSLLGDLATNTAHELVRAALEPDLTMYNLHGRANDDSYYPLSIGGKLVYWAAAPTSCVILRPQRWSRDCRTSSTDRSSRRRASLRHGMGSRATRRLMTISAVPCWAGNRAWKMISATTGGGWSAG